MTPLQKLREVCSKRTPGTWYFEQHIIKPQPGYLLMSTAVKREGTTSLIPCILDGVVQDDGNDAGISGDVADREFIEAASEHFETLVELAAAVAGACSFWKDCGYLDVKKDSDGFIAPEAAIAQELCKALAKLDGRGDGP